MKEAGMAAKATDKTRTKCLLDEKDIPAKRYNIQADFKPPAPVAQAYYNKKEKVTRLSTETGAGQWGSALSLACQLFGLQCKVYMVKVSYQQKPYRRIMMETWGAQVVASPSPDTQAGKKILEHDPNSPGSLGIPITAAVAS